METVSVYYEVRTEFFNPLNLELNPICYLLALLGAHHFLHVSRIRVKLDVRGSVHHSKIHKEKSNKIQRCIKILLLHIYIIIITIIIIIIIIIIIESIVASRNIGCLWVLSTSVYRLLRTLVHSSFYPLPWLPIFSSCFSVFLSSCFPEGSKVGQPLVSLHPLFLMCDRSI